MNGLYDLPEKKRVNKMTYKKTGKNVIAKFTLKELTESRDQDIKSKIEKIKTEYLSTQMTK